MTRILPPTGEAVLVCWMATTARAGPLLSALEEPSPLFGKIGRVYLLWRDPGGGSDAALVSEIRSALTVALDRFAPDLVDLRWVTDAPPTDHAAIRRFAEPQLRKIREDHPDAHIYLHLSPGTPSMHAVWLVLGATGFVAGPLTMIQTTPQEKRAGRAPIEAVPVEVDNWVRRFRASRPHGAMADVDGQLWDPEGFAPGGAMRATVERLLSWAAVPAPVLLLGERGTGKSSLANVLRAAAPTQRRGKDGLPVNDWPAAVCGQFRGDPQIARSELFGHVRGAFTGAEKSREGLLSAADGDCLFLDEIADLDRDTQRQLMHAVEGRGFRPVGGTTLLRSRFRLISATNRTLDELRELLDADFLDRIAMFKLTVPPLRACAADLGLFWRVTLRRAMTQADIEGRAWSGFAEDPALLSGLRCHGLPGNLRDLQGVAWHLAVAITAGLPHAECVAAGLAALTPPDHEPGFLSIEQLRSRLPLSEPLPSTLLALRGRWMAAALAESDGVQARAAALLGVPRETFASWARGTAGEDSPRDGDLKPVARRGSGSRRG